MCTCCTFLYNGGLKIYLKSSQHNCIVIAIEKINVFGILVKRNKLNTTSTQIKKKIFHKI